MPVYLPVTRCNAQLLQNRNNTKNNKIGSSEVKFKWKGISFLHD